MARGRTKREYPSLEDLPEKLRLAIMKIMASLNISDLEKGNDRAAFNLTVQKDVIDKYVNAEAENRYRSKHFKEMNKTQNTIRKNAYNQGHEEGYNEARDYWQIYYYCSVCGKK
jgi:hypothetical protein